MARKKKIKINPLPFKIIGVFLLSVLVGFGIYKGITKLFINSSYFSVKAILIDPELSFIEGRDTARIKGKNIFLIDLKKVKKKLEFKYPQIDNLKIVRIFPDQIHIKAEKRLPVAQIKLDGKILTLDTKAIVLSTKSRQDGTLPFILGIKRHIKYYLGAPVNNHDIRVALNILNAFKQISSLSSYKISDLDVSSLSKIELILNSKVKVILDKDKIERKVEMLGFILSQGQLKLDEVKYIDLRFKEPIVGKK